MISKAFSADLHEEPERERLSIRTAKTLKLISTASNLIPIRTIRAEFPWDIVTRSVRRTNINYGLSGKREKNTLFHNLLKSIIHKSLNVHLSQVITSHLFTWSNITIPKTDAATDVTIFITPHLDNCSCFFFSSSSSCLRPLAFSSVSATRGVAKRPQRRRWRPSHMGKTGYGARRDQGYLKNKKYRFFL